MVMGWKRANYEIIFTENLRKDIEEIIHNFDIPVEEKDSLIFRCIIEHIDKIHITPL